MYQLQTLISRHDFENLVSQYSGDRYVKDFTCWQQFNVMLYALASGKDSLRDIEHSFLAQEPKMYHLGLKKVSRSTLADANKERDYRITEQLFYTMIKRCKNITPKHGFRFKNPLMLLDATVIDLCLASFPWAKFRKRKGALKLHYQYDFKGEIPTFLTITDGKKHEITVARSFFTPVPDSIYCFDKGLIDSAWLYSIEQSKAFFVTRAKEDVKYRVIGQHESIKNNNIVADSIISFTESRKENYPKELRLIQYYDQEEDRILAFFTNNFKLAAITIAEIYKARWQIEIFFKWIKQNLKIKTFFGTSRNAVMTQIWVAMCYFLLLTYIKYQSKYKYSLFYLHKVIRETILERLNLIDLLNITDKTLPKIKNTDQQLALTF